MNALLTFFIGYLLVWQTVLAVTDERPLDGAACAVAAALCLYLGERIEKR